MTSNTASSMAETGGGGFEMIDVADVAQVADCVDECDRQQSCRAVDVNETSGRAAIACRFYLRPVVDSVEALLGGWPAPGVVQFVAQRCPEDGTYTCYLR